MIEPQNTTMPLPAEPAQVEAPQGDGMGFGEMLAQTLGMAPAIDPNLVQRITADGHEQSDEEPAGDPSAPDQGVVTVGRQVPTNRFVAVRPKETTPGIDPQVPAAGSGAAPDAVVAPVGDGVPEQPLPSPVAARGSVVPDKTPVDGLGKPVLTSAPPAVAEEQVAPAPQVLTPVDSVDLPVLTKDPEVPELPTTNPVGSPSPEPDVPQPVVLQPVVVDDQPRKPDLGAKTPTIPKQPNPTAQPAGPENVALGSEINTPVAQPSDQARVVAEVLPHAVDGQGPAPARPTRDRQLPVAPTPTAVAEGAPTVETSSVPVTDPAPTPRMNLNPDVPVRLDDPKAVVTSIPKDAGPVVFEPAAPAPAAPMPVAGVEAAPVQATVINDVVAAPIPHSALAERVLRAVELQANQPPPRTMVVDIPEIEGLRLVVSVRGGAQVHVVPTSGSPTSDGFQPFMNELNGVLSERGFVMTGDGRERGHNPNDPDQQLPTRLQRPTFRRPIRNDNDLRI